MLGEQDVDRELKAALSVSPSQDFEARVLQRVEADRPSRWPAHYGWLAAAASLVIVAGAFYALNRPPVVVEQAPAPQVAQRAAPRALPPQDEAPIHKNAGEPPRVETVRAARRAYSTVEPEVLVPLNQMEAVRRLGTWDQRRAHRSAGRTARRADGVACASGRCAARRPTDSAFSARWRGD